VQRLITRVEELRQKRRKERFVQSIIQRVTQAGFYGFHIYKAWDTEAKKPSETHFAASLAYSDGHQDIEGYIPLVTDDFDALLEAVAQHAEKHGKTLNLLVDAQKRLDEIMSLLTPEQIRELSKKVKL